MTRSLTSKKPLRGRTKAAINRRTERVPVVLRRFARYLTDRRCELWQNGGYESKARSSQVLLALIVAGLVLPITICVVLALASLLTAMGDIVGGAVLRYVALAGGIVTIVVLVGLSFSSIHTLWPLRQCGSIVLWRKQPCKAARMGPKWEFSTPNWKLASNSVFPVRSPSRSTPVPSDKILFSAAVLTSRPCCTSRLPQPPSAWALLPAEALREPWHKEDAENAAVQMRVPVEGKVLLDRRPGTKRGDGGAVIIAVPAEKPPDKPEGRIAGLRPDEAAASYR